MPGFGAVGRFAVDGWRQDVLILTFPTAEAIVLGEVAYQPGSGVQATVVPADLVLNEVAYGAAYGALVEAVAGDALVLSELALEARSGAAIAVVPADLVLGELATEILAGATVGVVPVDLVLEGAAYAPYAGVRIDFEIPSVLALEEAAYGPQSGTVVDLTPAEDLVLDVVEFDVPAGNRIDVVPYALNLEAVALEAYSGARVDTAAADLVLDSTTYAPGAGVLATFVPASDIIISAPAFSAQSGASVFVRRDRRSFYVSAVGAWPVAGGPASYVTRHYRTHGISFEVRTGATATVVPDDLILAAAAYEIGARRRSVRGQFLFYKN
jgi:hypothetical protein